MLTPLKFDSTDDIARFIEELVAKGLGELKSVTATDENGDEYTQIYFEPVEGLEKQLIMDEEGYTHFISDISNLSADESKKRFIVINSSKDTNGTFHHSYSIEPLKTIKEKSKDEVRIVFNKELLVMLTIFDMNKKEFNLEKEPVTCPIMLDFLFDPLALTPSIGNRAKDNLLETKLHPSTRVAINDSSLLKINSTLLDIAVLYVKQCYTVIANLQQSPLSQEAKKSLLEKIKDNLGCIAEKADGLSKFNPPSTLEGWRQLPPLSDESKCRKIIYLMIIGCAATIIAMWAYAKPEMNSIIKAMLGIAVTGILVFSALLAGEGLYRLKQARLRVKLAVLKHENEQKFLSLYERKIENFKEITQALIGNKLPESEETITVTVDAPGEQVPRSSQQTNQEQPTISRPLGFFRGNNNSGSSEHAPLLRITNPERNINSDATSPRRQTCTII